MSLINSGLDCLPCAVRICSRSLHVDGQLVQFHWRRPLSPPNGLDTFVRIQPTPFVWTPNSILLTDRSVPTVPCLYLSALTTVRHAGTSIHPRTPHRITNPTKESSTSHFSVSPFQLLHPPPPRAPARSSNSILPNTGGCFHMSAPLACAVHSPVDPPSVLPTEGPPVNAQLKYSLVPDVSLHHHSQIALLLGPPLCCEFSLLQESRLVCTPHDLKHRFIGTRHFRKRAAPK